MLHGHKNFFFLPVFLVISVFTKTVTAELDSTRIVFLDSLETVLRSDYLRCTNDSSDLPTKELLSWRRSIDSVIARPDYPLVAKKYFLETGISPANARPCEIVQWLRTFEMQLQYYTDVLAEAKTQRIKERDDSLYLANQLSTATKATYDFLDIPFGISRRAFILIANARGLPKPVGQGGFLRFDSLMYGDLFFKIAFHFSKDNHYRCYEIESSSCSLDSLDLWARPIMLYMAAQFEIKISTPPDHLYRIGLFDIVPGRLAICKLWNFSDANAYFGLARTANRFYAKAIIQKKE
jgi:hypothetical protein